MHGVKSGGPHYNKGDMNFASCSACKMLDVREMLLLDARKNVCDAFI